MSDWYKAVCCKNCGNFFLKDLREQGFPEHDCEGGRTMSDAQKDTYAKEISDAIHRVKMKVPDNTIIVVPTYHFLSNYDTILGMPILVTDSLGSSDWKLCVPSELTEQYKEQLRELHDIY